MSAKRGCRHCLLRIITEGCGAVNVFLIMFQFFIIKNGLQLIHSFAAISWNPITIPAQTDADFQTARKKYRCISSALVFLSGKYNSFVYTVWEFSAKLCTTKNYMDSFTWSGLLNRAGFPLFRELQSDIEHVTLLQHHWTVNLCITTHMALPMQPYPAELSPALSCPAFIFQVKSVLTSPPVFFRNTMG